MWLLPGQLFEAAVARTTVRDPVGVGSIMVVLTDLKRGGGGYSPPNYFSS